MAYTTSRPGTPLVAIGQCVAVRCDCAPAVHCSGPRSDRVQGTGCASRNSRNWRENPFAAEVSGRPRVGGGGGVQMRFPRERLLDHNVQLADRSARLFGNLARQRRSSPANGRTAPSPKDGMRQNVPYCTRMHPDAPECTTMRRCGASIVTSIRAKISWKLRGCAEMRQISSCGRAALCVRLTDRACNGHSFSCRRLFAAWGRCRGARGGPADRARCFALNRRRTREHSGWRFAFADTAHRRPPEWVRRLASCYCVLIERSRVSHLRRDLGPVLTAALPGGG